MRKNVIVRDMRVADRAAWADMRGALWPSETPQAHAAMIDALLEGSDGWCLIAETLDGQPVGFAEVALRDYANGCDSRPVAFLEGIWVAPQFRRRGVAAHMIDHAEVLVAARGLHELGSDTDFHNLPSQLAHQAWGFGETERVVYFRKLLTR